MVVEEAKHRLNILIENQLVRAYRVEQEVGSSFPLNRAINSFMKCLPEWAETIPNVRSFVYRAAIKARDDQQRAHMDYKIGEERRKRDLIQKEKNLSKIRKFEER